MPKCTLARVLVDSVALDSVALHALLSRRIRCNVCIVRGTHVHVRSSADVTRGLRTRLE